MKKSNENIDDLIKTALSEEEAEFYEQIDEPSIFELLSDVYKGKQKWIAISGTIMTFVFLILLIYCAIEFYNAKEVRDMLLWGAGGFTCLIAQSMLKLWSWMQMDKNHLLREIKRLELQVAMLSEKVKDIS